MALFLACLVTRNGQRNYKPVLAYHQLFWFHYSSNNTTGLCNWHSVIFLPYSSSSRPILYEGMSSSIRRAKYQADQIRTPAHGYLCLPIFLGLFPAFFFSVSSCYRPNLGNFSNVITALPWSNRWGLISGIWIRSTVGVPYAVVMIWAANASAGHTKKTTVIALYHIGYGLGNIISPQLFRPEWKVGGA